ncbi:uncharacterized protein B0I36DRAFT_152531 [Microdochium trichocladiopsis]|uniref:Sulfate transporter n=1 Tax=Microdochium trichocladiopsis TaxID=1682393 RepID=A0A9P8XZF8_9PEZI|nr:uncharacterized protein B0I36DRAFT_152531 [Microdochium trichocladiopsis]KAH7025999.1 hypothetical protein B0I36DRAFT_152531 [Microdochium trichocladiopsis]
MASFSSHIKQVHRNNVAVLRRSPTLEIAGALGDLGTLLPLMIVLAVNGSISLSTTLVFSGIFNLATGVIFGVPLPVQPMKAIAAAAIASHASQRETLAAGSVTATVVLLLSITGLLHWVTRIIPVPVIKGIQLGAGLSLIIAAGASLLRPLSWLYPFDNRIWAIAAFLGLLTSLRQPRIPYALVVFVSGLILAILQVVASDNSDSSNRRLPSFRVWEPYFVLPSWTADAVGMGIAQLPLTTLNSVVAVNALASDLMPDLPTPSVTALGTSVGIMNVMGCWFGAMPVCHGAGGLAAQFRFGARSGASIILLGAFKLVLGLFLGETLLDLLHAFPASLLGIMVIAAGLELAKVGQSLNHGAPDLWESSAGQKKHRDITDGQREERWTVMMTTTAGILAFKNDAIGFAAGLLCHAAYRRWGRPRQNRFQDPSDEGSPLIRA